MSCEARSRRRGFSRPCRSTTAISSASDDAPNEVLSSALCHMSQQHTDNQSEETRRSVGSPLDRCSVGNHQKLLFECDIIANLDKGKELGLNLRAQLNTNISGTGECVPPRLHLRGLLWRLVGALASYRRWRRILVSGNLIRVQKGGVLAHNNVSSNAVVAVLAYGCVRTESRHRNKKHLSLTRTCGACYDATSNCYL